MPKPDWHKSQRKADAKVAKSLDNIVKLLSSNVIFIGIEYPDSTKISTIKADLQKIANKYRNT